MKTKKSNIVLYIYLQQVLVGTYIKKADGSTTFQYEKSWLTTHFSISRSIKLSKKIQSGEHIRAFFDNLLPDLKETREFIASKLQANSSDHFDLLIKTGMDAVGALTFSNKPIDKFPKSQDSSPLSNYKIEKILKNLHSKVIDEKLDFDNFRISLAGAQEKTAFCKKNGKWSTPHGGTPTTHIFKPPMSHELFGLDSKTSVDNEYFCMKLIKGFGIPVANVEIGKFGQTKSLIIERFDRFEKNDLFYRVHQEDLCQALGIFSSLKYQSDGGPSAIEIVEILKEGARSQQDVETFFQAQVAFYILGAIDGHAKNYSIQYTQRGHQLAPIYDVLSIYPALSAKLMSVGKFKMALSIAGEYRFKKIRRRHFIRMAENFTISPTRTSELIDQLIYKVDAKFWELIKLPKNFDKAVAQKIISGIKIYTNSIRD